MFEPQPGSAPSSQTPDRAAAEWAFAAGGNIGVRLLDGVWVDVKPGDNLPAGHFQVVLIALERKAITDTDLARLDGLLELTMVYLGNTSIGDEGIAQMGHLPKLQKAYLRRTQITDAAVLDLVARYPTLDTLHAGGTKVTDRGVSALATLANLQSLRLENPGVTDASLNTLAGLKNLRLLCLQGSKVSREGIERLRQALPQCRIESDYGDFEPTKQ